MVCDCLTKKLVFVIICGLAGLCSLPGCTRSDYKKDADEKVYNIIDKKWKNEFGPKANYKISDTVPSPNDIQTEKAIPASGILTLPQAVAIATAHNREYQTQKESLYIKALDLGLTRHQFETQFFGGAIAGYGKDRNDEVFGIEPAFGFNRLLAGGTTISTAVGAAWADVMSGNLRSGLAAILSATVTQPLLRGSDRTVVLENLTQAERDMLYQVRSFNRFRKTFVVSIVTQYYQVLQLFNAVKNAHRNYNTIAWLHKRVEKLGVVGRLPKYEVDEASQKLLQALDIYVQAERDYKQALDAFKITLSLPPQAECQLDPNELGVLMAAEMIYPDFSEAESIETALSRRLDLVNSADAVIDAQRKVLVAADGLHADLNLTGNISANTSRRADYRTLKPLKSERGLDLELGLPLDRVPEQNVYRKALITLNQQQRNYEQAADAVALEVRTAYRDLVKAAQQYKVQLEALNTAQKRFKETFLLMQYARANSRRVLDAQKDLFDAQNTVTESLIAYTIATLNFYRDTEVLGVRPDGMWEHTILTSAQKVSTSP